MDLFKVLGGQEADFNTNAWKYVTDVLSSSTVKVGTYLIIFFLIFEIAKIFEEANRNNEGTVVPITMLQAGVTACLAGAMVASVHLIFPFINSISAGAISLIKDLGTYNVISPSSPSAPSFWDGLGKIMAWVIEYLAGTVASIIVLVVIVMRTLQMYIYTILAPLAFSSFASREYRSIGISFLKQYCAVCLQGFVILIILGISNYFSAPNGSGTLAGGLVAVIKPIVVAVLVFQSGRIAKEVVGLGG